MSYLRDGFFELIAHRGGSFEAPENTMTAFEHARAVYSDSVFELDVNLTRDGQVAVIHDGEVDRTTNGTGRICDMTYVEISKLDAGYKFTIDDGKDFPFRSKNIQVPLLKDVLERFPQTRISIEFKRGKRPFHEDVLKIIDSFNARDRVVLASGEHDLLSLARKAAPEICAGYSSREILQAVVTNRLRLPRLNPRAGKVYQIPVSHNGIEVLNKRFVDNAHMNRKHVHVWTINDEPTMIRCLELGVDGIITDAPSLLLRVARRLKRL